MNCLIKLDKSYFRIPSLNTVFSGAESIRFLASKICDAKPDEMKCLGKKNGNQYHVHADYVKKYLHIGFLYENLVFIFF